MIRQPETGPVREVFLLLPGLNLHPGRLSPWEDVLLEQGCAVARPPLTGYRAPRDAGWRSVSADTWLADLDAAKAAVALAHPEARLSVLGYSMGAVLGTTWAALRGVTLARTLLLSPAFALQRRLALLLGLLCPVLPARWCIPSRAPAAYRMHDRTSVAAYRALLDLQRRFRGLVAAKAPPPADRLFVAYHPRDELIDTDLLAALARAHPTRTSVHPLAHTPRPGYLAHLGLDAYTLGEAEWAGLREAAADWLAVTAPMGQAPTDAGGGMR